MLRPGPARCGRNRSAAGRTASRWAPWPACRSRSRNVFTSSARRRRMGIAQQCAGELADEDSPLVRRLTAAGAIVLGKTNVPQLMVMHETDNPLYGRTNNPWNLDRSPGGSSGGEAAIVAAGGSALGLGSDLGGSIRQPAHSVGICGLLPTQGRIEMSGRRGNFYGLESLSLQPGPMARTVDDLEIGLSRAGRSGAGRRTIRASRRCELGDSRRDRRAPSCGSAWSRTTDSFPAAPAVRRAVGRSGPGIVGRRRRGADICDPRHPRGDAALLSSDHGRRRGESDPHARRRDRPDWRIRRLLRLGRMRRPARRVVVSLLRAAGHQRLAELVERQRRRRRPIYYWQRTERSGPLHPPLHARARCGRASTRIVMPPHALAGPDAWQLDQFESRGQLLLSGQSAGHAGRRAAGNARASGRRERSTGEPRH